jgi:hypothetical protein
MFEQMDIEISKKNRHDSIQMKMKECLPQIYNAIYPSATSIATQMRIQIEESRDMIKRFYEENKDKITLQREIFQTFLNKFQNIGNRIKKITK